MVKLSWGVKRTCQSCSSRFYDLQRSPITCPKCGSVYEILTTTKRSRNRAIPEAAKVVPFGVEDQLLDVELDLEVDIDEDSINDVLIDDASDLEEDLTEMSDVIEVEKDDI